jgi:hypothetical protein
VWQYKIEINIKILKLKYYKLKIKVWLFKIVDQYMSEFHCYINFSLFCFSCGSYPVFFPVYSCVQYSDSFLYLLLLLSLYTLYLYVHHCWYPHRCPYFLLVNYSFVCVEWPLLMFTLVSIVTVGNYSLCVFILLIQCVYLLYTDASHALNSV